MLYIFVLTVLGVVFLWVVGMFAVLLTEHPKDKDAILALVLVLLFTGGLSLGMFLLALNA